MLSAGRANPHASTPGDSATTSPSATPSPSSALPSTSARADFRLVKEFDCDEASLHALQEKTFLSCGQELFVLEGDEVRSDPTYQRGLEHGDPYWQIVGMGGHWPDAAWLGTTLTPGRTIHSELFGWIGARWQKVGDTKLRQEPLVKVLPWTEQRAVALVECFNSICNHFMPLGNKPFAVPQFTRPAMPNDDCDSRIRIEAIAVLSPGDIMVAGGQACDVVLNGRKEEVRYTGIGIERLRAGLPQGEFSLLDGLPAVPRYIVWHVNALVAMGPSEVMLAASAAVSQTRNVGYFARWAGTKFVEQAMPIDGIVDKLWLEKTDVLWATDLQGQLWRGHTGKMVRVPWEKPGGQDTEITHVWASGPNDIWLLTRGRSVMKSALYHGHWDASM